MTASEVKALLAAADQQLGFSRSQLLAAARASSANEVIDRKRQAAEFECLVKRLRARAARASLRVVS